jgi:D-glycero-D-manno-heptose 1,7-bisphosphate phosphatase
MKKKIKKFKIAFLDRDGVINSSKFNNGYIGKIIDFRWIPGAKKTIQFLKKRGYKVVIVSNQSGVGRGYFNIKDVHVLHRYISNELKKICTRIDRFYFCPFHKYAKIKKYKKNSCLRKPNNGMFHLVNKKWPVDKSRSFMIGDRSVDMKFAKKSKITGFLYKEKILFTFVKKKLKNIEK